MIFVGLFIIHRLPSIYLIALKSTPATRHGVGDNPLYIRPVRASLAEVRRPQGTAMLQIALLPWARSLAILAACASVALSPRMHSLKGFLPAWVWKRLAGLLRGGNGRGRGAFAPLIG